MSIEAKPNILSWSLLPYLLIAGLCIGIMAGVINYKQIENSLQLAPEIAQSADATESQVMPKPEAQKNGEQIEILANASDLSASSTHPESRVQPMEWNTTVQSFVPTYLNYEVAVADSRGIRFKTIVNR
ncbi:MAG TPA: hypothetical protein EYN91_15330 [Candidatus Melainabacteria bacterium]|nr:hypothetical protein [Candidatus Melainabacteria bacterium]HIN64806.1 hypothetical protein [Candidatus Obscuribacterales bacterium]